eukprot:11081713-Heterocapsa_arctica.AAC.1
MGVRGGGAAFAGGCAGRAIGALRERSAGALLWARANLLGRAVTTTGAAGVAAPGLSSASMMNSERALGLPLCVGVDDRDRGHVHALLVASEFGKTLILPNFIRQLTAMSVHFSSGRVGHAKELNKAAGNGIAECIHLDELIRLTLGCLVVPRGILNVVSH